MINTINELSDIHKKNLSKNEINEKLMEKRQDMVKYNVQDELKKYQDNTNKKLEKTQKHLNKLREDFNKYQSETKARRAWSEVF
jgi:hypothetical protein